MIQLHNRLDNIVYVNSNHIEALEVCQLGEACSFVQLSHLHPNDSSSLGVRIHLTSGKTLIVRECMRDINDKIKELKDGT